jgi:lipopolysaccharide/colanic/teichoic acid biosynthesis glycosyltransferase
MAQSGGRKSRKNKENKKQHIFRRGWEGWKKIARKIGDFNARVILTIFYFILMLPFALLVRLLTDPLHIKEKSVKRWRMIEKKPDLTPLERAEKQF